LSVIIVIIIKGNLPVFICVQILWDFKEAYGEEVASLLLQRWMQSAQEPLLKYMSCSWNSILVRFFAEADSSDPGELFLYYFIIVAFYIKQ